MINKTLSSIVDYINNKRKQFHQLDNDAEFYLYYGDEFEPEEYAGIWDIDYKEQNELQQEILKNTLPVTYNQEDLRKNLMVYCNVVVDDLNGIKDIDIFVDCFDIDENENNTYTISGIANIESVMSI